MGAQRCFLLLYRGIWRHCLSCEHLGSKLWSAMLFSMQAKWSALWTTEVRYTFHDLLLPFSNCNGTCKLDSTEAGRQTALHCRTTSLAPRTSAHRKKVYISSIGTYHVPKSWHIDITLTVHTHPIIQCTILIDFQGVMELFFFHPAWNQIWCQW